MATLPDPEDLVRMSCRGDRRALGRVLHVMAELVYPLAICMLGGTRAAGQATETIVLRLVTALGSADGALRTWVYRVASRHLLTTCDASLEDVMLLFLDRDLRIAFVLGDVLALEIDEAADVLAVPPDVILARRSRARSRVCEHYGLVDPAALLRSLAALGPPATLADDLCTLIAGR